MDHFDWKEPQLWHRSTFQNVHKCHFKRSVMSCTHKPNCLAQTVVLPDADGTGVHLVFVLGGSKQTGVMYCQLHVPVYWDWITGLRPWFVCRIVNLLSRQILTQCDSHCILYTGVSGSGQGRLLGISLTSLDSIFKHHDLCCKVRA